MAAFRYAVQYACHKHVPYIFGAGDLIDIKKPPPEVVQFVRAQLDKLEKNSIEFFFIQGQHEYSPDLPWFCAIHDWPQWLNQRYVTIADNCNVYGLDWRPADAIPDAFENIPHDTDILLSHQVWEEFMGEKCGCECSFATVPHAHTVFTGDYHVNRHIKVKRLGEDDLEVISPGSTNMRKIDETQDKYFYVLLSDMTWKRIRIPTRRKFELSIHSETSLKHFPENYKAQLADVREYAKTFHLDPKLTRPLFRVIYHDDIADAYKTIKDTVDPKDVELFLKPVPANAPEAIKVDRQAFDQASSRGLVAMLGTVVEQDSASYKILSRLLTCPDTKLELQRMKKERGLV